MAFLFLPSELTRYAPPNLDADFCGLYRFARPDNQRPNSLSIVNGLCVKTTKVLLGYGNRYGEKQWLDRIEISFGRR